MDINDIKTYKKKLEREIHDYIEKVPMSERSVHTIKEMEECWEHMDKFEKMLEKDEFVFDEEVAHDWAKHIKNEDGTTGPHWTIEQTSAVAKNAGVVFDKNLPDWCWHITMCMIYSDYCKVADKYGINTPEFYANMSKAFLYDRDYRGTPLEKLASYYWYVYTE